MSCHAQVLHSRLHQETIRQLAGLAWADEPMSRADKPNRKMKPTMIDSMHCLKEDMWVLYIIVEIHNIS